MKQYGMKKATEFSKSQISVVYGKAKSGALKVEKWFMHELYVLADYYGFDDNRNVEFQEREILAILDAVFTDDLATAQELIDRTATSWFNDYGRKTQAKCDRNAFVGQ